MVFRFECLDIIADAFSYGPIEDDVKLTVLSMPLYAVFKKRHMFLPLRYEDIGILLGMSPDSLRQVGLRKAELLTARNEFLRFENEEELYLLSGPDEIDSACGDSSIFLSARATSGGI